MSVTRLQMNEHDPLATSMLLFDLLDGGAGVHGVVPVASWPFLLAVRESRTGATCSQG